MTNSPLVTFTLLSPNSSNPRNKPITKITIHHMAGNLSVEQCGELFAPPGRQASSNYGIGSDGRVAMYVEEKNRAWTSSSSANDNQAVTIEVANNSGAPVWSVSDKALAALIDLCTDICKRNGIAELVFDGTPNGSLTHHRMFASTSCPGPYLLSKFPHIAEEVNKRLEVKKMPEKRYNWIDEIPEWGKATIEKLVLNNWLKGDGNGLNLSEDMIRLLVVLDRKGLFD